MRTKYGINDDNDSSPFLSLQALGNHKIIDINHNVSSKVFVQVPSDVKRGYYTVAQRYELILFSSGKTILYERAQ